MADNHGELMKLAADTKQQLADINGDTSALLDQVANLEYQVKAAVSDAGMSAEREAEVLKAFQDVYATANSIAARVANGPAPSDESDDETESAGTGETAPENGGNAGTEGSSPKADSEAIGSTTSAPTSEQQP